MDNTSLNMSTAFILCPKCLWRHRQHFLDISTVFLLCLKYPWGHRQHFSDISTVFLLCPKYLWRHRQHFSDLSTAFLDPSIIINICYLRETEACVVCIGMASLCGWRLCGWGVGWSYFEEKMLYSCRTSIPKLHALMLHFHLSKGLGKFWMFP